MTHRPSAILLSNALTAILIAAVGLVVFGVTPGARQVRVDETRVDESRSPAQATDTQGRPAETATSAEPSDDREAEIEEAWDYSPYRVQVWIAADDPRLSAAALEPALQAYFDRDFSALWRLSIADAPISVRTAATRGLHRLDYDAVTATDPVVAVKRNHDDAPRIRFAGDVGTYVKRCLSTADRIEEVRERGKAVGKADLNGISPILKAIDGDASAVIARWADADTEAVLTNRGMARKLKDPEAKIVSLPIDDLVTETIERNDKLFIVHVDSGSLPWKISAVEIDCLMRDFSTVRHAEIGTLSQAPRVIGRTVSDLFAPMVRIEDAGQKNARGLVRAAGLVTDEDSPALLRENDFLVPMLRKNDRNGDPIGIGPLDWAYLHVKSVEGTRVEMDYQAGKAGGLQGRQNRRTFRTANRVRPFGDSTVIRLHEQRKPDSPLVGYELYERPLDSPEMTFVGRTDWNGRIRIDKTDTTMRLLYVKNGGAVLARLPIVPGQSEIEVADLMGDDQRLRAEAYIRSVQNSIVDLVAIRQLLAARIRLRLEEQKVTDAEELLESLREEPSYEKIAGDMGRKLIQYKGRTPAEQMKIDQMFAQTREMLVKNINPALVRDLEAEVLSAKRKADAEAEPADTAAAQTAATADAT